MSYLKREPIDDLNDLSLVNPEIEDKSNIILTLEIFKDSVFNIVPLLLLVITESINLIAIGHSQIDIKYFNFFQIGAVFLNIFGFVFALGSLNIAKKEDFLPTLNNFKIQRYYIHTKLFLMYWVIFIIIPVAWTSYFSLCFIYNSDSSLKTMIWLIYTQVLIYAPGFIYCQIYLQLNLKILQIYNKRNISYAIVILHILAQIVLIYLLVFILNYGVQGIIFSITISSFFSYFFSNMIINEMHVIENNFYFYNLENVIIENDTIKNYLFAGLFSYFEYAGFAFFVIFSYFISDEAQAANIILLNFLSFLHIFGKGLAQTLKNYIQLSMSRYKHSHIGKKKFVKFLSIVTFFIALTFSIIILTFDKTIVRIYLSAPLPQEILDISKMFSHIVNFFAIVIFFDYLSKVLDGYVKGIDAATTYLMIYKISFLVVFIPIALVLCFKLKLGLIGFWMIIYFYVILYTLINAFYVYKYYSIWFK